MDVFKICHYKNNELNGYDVGYTLMRLRTSLCKTKTPYKTICSFDNLSYLDEHAQKTPIVETFIDSDLGISAIFKI